MRKPLSFLAIFACALVACKGGGAAGATGAPAAMTASYASKNGLLTAHYPADFTASTVGTSSTFAERRSSTAELDRPRCCKADLGSG
jgi:hypothetical protein